MIIRLSSRRVCTLLIGIMNPKIKGSFSKLADVPGDVEKALGINLIQVKRPKAPARELRFYC